MNGSSKRINILTLVVALLVLLTGCGTTRRESTNVEYKVVRLTWSEKGSPDGELNALAKQGWRVQDSNMSYTPHVYTGVFLMKRSH